MRSPRRRSLLSTVAASVLLVLATACSSGSDDSADGQVGETAPEATADEATGPAEPAGAVPEALQFTAPLVGGGTFDGAASAGKPTVFWFWAPT